MDKQEYKQLAERLNVFRMEHQEDNQLADACNTLIEHCEYKSKPSLLNLIKAVRSEMPWLGLKDAKDLMEKFISDNS